MKTETSTGIRPENRVLRPVRVVRDGQLVAVRSGQAKADGTVTVEGVEIGRKMLTFPLTAELALRSLRDAQGPLLTS